MVIRKEFYIPSSDGKTKLHCVSWKPREVLGTLQITHGMTEYILRYDEFAQYLAQQGIWVMGHDHLGHGKSSTFGGLGFFSECDGKSILIKDIARVTNVINRRVTEVPHIILGHSMGSFFLRRYLTVYGGKVDGAIIMGTGYHSLPAAMIGRGVTRGIGKIKGMEYRSELMQKLVLGNYNRVFRPNRTTNDWLSRDESMVDKFLEDSYCTFYFSCAAYKDFFDVLIALGKKSNIKRIPRKLPILVISGAKDPVGGCGKGVKKVYDQLKKIGIQDVSLKLYEDARHEILNETNRKDVYEDISTWFFSRIHKV